MGVSGIHSWENFILLSYLLHSHHNLQAVITNIMDISDTYLYGCPKSYWKRPYTFSHCQIHLLSHMLHSHRKYFYHWIYHCNRQHTMFALFCLLHSSHTQDDTYLHPQIDCLSENSSQNLSV